MANIDNVQLPDGSSYNIVDNTSGFASQSYVDSAVSSITKTTIGLGNVDNTSDLNKPISTATQTALDTLDEDKADKTDIATVESGTTASRAYSVGELVYVSGTLYEVKTAIASGATFTPGTNVEVTNVSNAIGNKGSVSVTANGNKTLSTLLNELFTLIEHDKVGVNTKFKIGAQLYHIATISSVMYRFGVTTVSGTNVAMYAISINASSSASYATSIGSGGSVYYNNESATVPSTGSVLEIIY